MSWFSKALKLPTVERHWMEELNQQLAAVRVSAKAEGTPLPEDV